MIDVVAPAAFDKSARAGCQRCPRREARYVPPTIRVGSEIMFIAESPGKNENERGEVLVGASGKVLNQLCDKSGIDRDASSLANSVACYLNGNPTPTVEEVECCAPVLEEAIEAARPRVIVALGGVATTRLVGERKIGKWQGSVMLTPTIVQLGTRTVVGAPAPMKCKACKGKGSVTIKKPIKLAIRCEACAGVGTIVAEERFKSGTRTGELKPRKLAATFEQPGGRRVVVTYHPSALMESGFAEWILVVAALRRARTLAREPEALITFGKQIISEPQDASLAGLILEAASEITLDVETDGKDGKLTSIGLAPDKDYGVTFRPTRELVEVLRRALAEPTRTLVGQNLDYDVRQLEAWQLVDGVELHPSARIRVQCALWDTMHAAHFERPDLPEVIRPKSLETITSRFPEVYYYNWKEAFRSGSAADLGYYNASDCCATAMDKQILAVRLAATGRLVHFERHMMRALPVLIKLRQEGVRVDRDLLASFHAQQSLVVAALQDEWNRTTGGVNHASTGATGQLRAYVHGTLGLPEQFVGRGKTRRQSLDADVIEALVARYPVQAAPLATLVALRHASKILATYFELELDAGGRFHAEYNLSGSTFGRLSGDMQQVPRTGRGCAARVGGCLCYRARELFIHDEGDWAWGAGDSSQIEFRLWGPLSGDPGVAAVYGPGGHNDIHRWGASRLFNVDPAAVTKEQRQAAKTCVHGGFFERGEVAIAEEMGIPLARAVAFKQMLNADFPMVQQYKMALLMQARREGYVTNPFGRRCYFRVSGAQRVVKATEVASATPQSTAGDMMTIACYRAAEAGLKLRLSLHDELGISARDERDVALLREVMEAPHAEIPASTPGGWSCPADVGSGANWALAKQ